MLSLHGKAGEKSMSIGDLNASFMVGSSSQIACWVHHFYRHQSSCTTDNHSLVFFTPTGDISVHCIHYNCWQSSSSLLDLHNITLYFILLCHVLSAIFIIFLYSLQLHSNGVIIPSSVWCITPLLDWALVL